MGTVIIIVILAVIVLLAIRSGLGHFKGEGGCCGSGPDKVQAVDKSLSGETIGKVVLTVEGMHCENCQNRVANALNRMDGVAAEVNWKTKRAAVSLDRPVSDGKLRAAVENLGYKVSHVEHKEV